MNHSPEPWKLITPSPGKHWLLDANDLIILEHSEGTHLPGDSELELMLANVKRMMACVNACAGIPDINGVITMIGDMKVAILTGDQEMAALIRRRLLELAGETANDTDHAGGPVVLPSPTDAKAASRASDGSLTKE